MRSGMVSLLALAALAAGCSRIDGDDGGATPAPTGPEPTATATGPEMEQFKGLYALPDCPTGNPVQMVNIILPRTFDGKKIVRDVNQGPVRAKGSSDPKGASMNAPNSPKPFDVFVHFAGPSPTPAPAPAPTPTPSPTNSTGATYPTQGLVLVRAILMKGSDFHFHDRANFHGIAANDPNQQIICGAEVIKAPTDDPTVSPAPPSPGGGQGGGPGQDKAGEIALFYVNLANLNNAVMAEFTIGLEAGSGADMVKLLIDPKIMNDGGGMRNDVK